MHSDQRSAKFQRLFATLKNPWIDKTIALIAVLPFIYGMYMRLHSGDLNIPRVTVAMQSLLIIATMLVRREPVRITPNPWFWLLAFLGTYWGFGYAVFGQKGVALTPIMVTNSIAIFSLAIHVYARLSLGRSMGFVPAQRVIITSGAYQFVRHPIYAGTLISLVSFVLRMYSPINVGLALIGGGLLVVKCLIEESFLKEDPAYAAYFNRVRYRWIPGIL